MYTVVKTPETDDNNNTLAFSVADENRIYYDITDDEEIARNFVNLLNEFDADEIHIAELTEDFFYR